MYEMNEEAFSLLVGGFTGAEAENDAWEVTQGARTDLSAHTSNRGRLSQTHSPDAQATLLHRRALRRWRHTSGGEFKSCGLSSQ